MPSLGLLFCMGWVLCKVLCFSKIFNIWRSCVYPEDYLYLRYILTILISPNMKYPYLIILLLLTVSSLRLMGQGRVRFAYDAAGNRVRRELVVGSKKPKGLRTLSTDSTQQATSDLNPRDEADRRHLSGRDYVTETIDRGQVRIYPNPTEGELTIEFLGYRPEQRAVLVVYDLFGRVVVRREVASMTTMLDLSGQSAGLYVLHLIVGKDRSVWKIRKN